LTGPIRAKAIPLVTALFAWPCPIFAWRELLPGHSVVCTRRRLVSLARIMRVDGWPFRF